MKLTDQEQVVIKAIGQHVASISQVIRAVGYPKATVKKVLIGLNEKGIVALHRHDYPQSLLPAQRKLMVRIGRDYFTAVSMRKRNPEKSKGKKALKTTGRALKGFARGALSAGAQILGAGATALNPQKFITLFSRLNNGDKFKIHQAAGGFSQAARHKTLTKVSADVAEGSKKEFFQISGSTNVVLISRHKNPTRRIKVRNKYVDLVIKGQAKKTPDGWRVGKKTFAQGRGTVNVSSGYYLDRSTGTVYAKRERNTSVGRKAKRSRLVSRASALKTTAKGRKPKRRSILKRRNVSEGFYDASGTFHPIRSSADYSPAAAGETGGRSRKTRSKKKTTAKRKASSTARRRSLVKTRKATTKRLAGRAIRKSSGLLKSKKRGRKNPSPAVLAIVNRAQSKAAKNRKEFAGEYRKDLPLRYPEGTPKGLSKLGKLLKIKTDRATITPINNQTWLVRDLKGKLHIGTTSKDGLIWSGAAEDFGQVKRIEYEDIKKHLGYDQLQGFYHFMGEEDGIRPRLCADGKGGLKFRGGNYRITPEGIVN